MSPQVISPRSVKPVDLNKEGFEVFNGLSHKIVGAKLDGLNG